MQRVAERIATGVPIDETVRSVKHEISQLLMLRDIWLELAPFRWPLPSLERAGTIEAGEHRWIAGGFVLPEDGLQLPVLAGGCTVARLVLIGDPARAVMLDERVVAVALADQLGSALATVPPETRSLLADDPPPES